MKDWKGFIFINILIIIGILCLLLSLYFACAGFWNLIYPIKIIIGIAYLMLSCGLTWVGLHHIIFSCFWSVK